MDLEGLRQLQWDCNVSISLRYSDGVDKYPAKAHARRVAEQVQQQHGLIVLLGTRSANWPNSDMPAPFRQDRYFYYLSGCNEPDCYVTYDIKKDLLTLWLPPVDDDWRHVVYYGNGSTVEEALERYDIDEARYIKIKKPEGIEEPSIYALMRSYWSLDRIVSRSATSKTRAKAMKYSCSEFTRSTKSPVLELSSLRTALDTCRVIKDAHEINLIRKANKITAAAHTRVMKGMHRFVSESEVEAAYMQTCIARRAKEQAYDPIAGSGPNAAVLHYSNNLADFGKGQTVVLDAGCEVERYASDVTRTIPINRINPGEWPSQEAENIYKLVEMIQESCIKQLLPGNLYIETQFHAHHMLIQGLLKLGILKGDPKDVLRAGISSAFLPHGLGHHLGLDVHDVSPVPPPPTSHCFEEGLDACIRRLRDAYVKWNPESVDYINSFTQPEHFGISSNCHALVTADAPGLEPGMVVTVEPGIYFNEYLIQRLLSDPKQSEFINAEVLQRYIPVGGVRIEDDILITKHGYENLTTAPKGEEMLKVIRDAAQSTLKDKVQTCFI